MQSKVATSKRRLNYSLILYFLGTIVYIAYSFLQTTLFSTLLPNSVFTLGKYLALAFFVLRILTAKYNTKQIIIVVWGALLALLIFHSSGDTSILMLIAFILSSMNTNLDHTINIYLVIATILTLFTVGSSLIGVIANYSYVVSGATRYAFGFLYTTDFAAHVFYLCLAFAYIARTRINIVYVIIPTILSVVLFYFTRAKLDSILMVLISIVLAFYRYTDLKKIKAHHWILVIVPVVMMLISILSAFIYMPTNHIFAKVDSLLTNRLAMGHLALFEYPVKFFGQYIAQQGSGGASFQTGLTNDGINQSYFFIDSSYIKILLALGLVFLVVYMFGLSRAISTALKQKSYMISLILVIICVSSLIDQHLLEIAYNPFLICVLVNCFTKDKVVVKK